MRRAAECLECTIFLLGVATCAGVTTVTLPYGIIHGRALQKSREFMGIPFAAPPKRFAAPQPWTAAYPNGSLEALSFSKPCMQQATAAGTPSPLVVSPELSEDW